MASEIQRLIQKAVMQAYMTRFKKDKAGYHPYPYFYGFASGIFERGAKAGNTNGIYDT